MKRIILFVLLGMNLFVHAQNYIPGKFDRHEFGHELVAANLVMEADKNLAELNEAFNVHVRIMVADDKTFVPQVYLYDFKDPFDAPWKVSEFRIISGGATVVMTDGPTAQLRMPATMPKEKAVMVQATLTPVTKEYQQVLLFTTIYLEDNKNVFYFNCPALGINHEKYVIKNNGGVLTKPNAAVATAIDKKIAQKKVQEYTMKAAGAEVAATEHGFDLAALTSNAKAVYAKEEDVTSIIINDNRVEMVNGQLSGTKRPYTIAISFPGKATGDFVLKTKKQINIGIALPLSQTGCACGDDPEDKKRRDETGEPGPTCFGGTLHITRYDPKTKLVEGNFVAQLESSDKSGNIFYGTLNGKFSVPLAN